ncbi:MAG: hypothetical protein ACPG6K_03780 [Pseudohongiellaceae bacterium]
MRLITFFLIAMALVACEVDTTPRFERMSFEELAEYNRGKPLSQMIVCDDENRSFSRVRRRSCMTVEARYGSQEQIGQLGVLNSIPGYSGVE